MASPIGEVSTIDQNSATPTRNNRPKMTLGNESDDQRANPSRTESQSQPTKPLKKIHTFVVWSIFNLLLVPFGIVCCYFSYRVRQFKAQNRYPLATKWSRRTLVINCITTLLMASIIITVVMLHRDYVERHPDLNRNQTRTTGAFIPWQPGR